MAKKSGTTKPTQRRSASKSTRTGLAGLRTRTRMMALEPRMLFDGALAVDLTAAATADAGVDAKAPAADATAAPASFDSAQATQAQPGADAVVKPVDERVSIETAASPAREILFIDGNVSDIDQIKAATREGVEVVVLDPSRDGITQISEALAARSGIDAVHIVSHGGPGEIKLGSAVLNADTLVERMNEVGEWGRHLSAGADLMLYGCDVAAGEQGAAYIQMLAACTHADVAGSTNITGAASAGGDWSLEAQTGRIQAGLFGSEKFLADINIELANTAPVLNASFSPTMSAELEDAGTPSGAVGTLVSSLVGIGGNVSDPDVGAKTGVAVVGADSANGTWYYSTNNGTSWTALGSVSTSSARLLAADANSRLYFKPNANWNGTLSSAITFRAWDQTTGASGGTADTTSNGGATAYSSATEQASLTVLSVNDAPTGTSSTINIAQAGAYIFKTSDFGFSDVDGNNFLAVKVDSLPSGPGSLQVGGANVTVGQYVSITDIVAGRFQYIGDNASSRQFNFQVQDDGGTANAGVDTDPTQRTITMSQRFTNTAPSWSGAASNFASITELQTGNSGQLVSSLMGTVTDPDAGQQLGIAITATSQTNGSWEYSTDGGATWTAVGTVSGASSLLLRPTDYVRFAPTGFGSGSSITYRAWDETNGFAGQKVSTATNGGTSAYSTTTLTSSIAVTDVAPILTSPTSVSVAEGTSTSTAVYTATATDVETVSYSLGGTDASAFTINSATGAVTFNAIPNYETKTSYSINVVASDGTLSSSQAVTVNITDLPPSFSSATGASINEAVAAGSTVYTAVAADPAGGAVTYSLVAGGDASAFTINSSTGAVTINSIPDYETKSAYSFTVKAADPSGQYTTQAVTINVNDLPPAFSSGTSASVNEGVAAGSTVYTAVAADPAGGAVTYSLVAGGDAAAFSINSSTGAVTINSAPDFETKSSYSFTVKASDPSGQFTTQAVTINVNDVAPAFSSGTSASVNEAVAAGSTVYTAVAADPAGGAVTYSLVAGGDAAAFSINGATGVVTINSTPDFETKSSYSFTVKASDPSGAFTTQAVTINVTDLPPSFSSGTSASVNEGVAAGSTVYTAVAADPAGGAVTYSLAAGGDAAAFSINSATGAVTINSMPDFETKSSYSFSVKASDASGAFTTQAVTVSITDVAPTITSATTVSVAEGTSTSTVVYTASATDPAGGAVTYSLTGADAGAFTINSSTGAVTFNAVPDFETRNSYSFNVKASDPSGAFNTQAVTLSVTDVAPTITSATAVSVAEGTSTATVVYTASATDPAGGAVTYSLAGADAGAFTIDSSTGAVRFNAVPDFETKTSYSFNVKASDASGAFNTQAVTLTVTDVAPSISSATTASVAEGTSTATVVYTAAATDPAGGAVTYSLTGADAGAFSIDSSTGAVTFNAVPDFETKSSYSFNVKASDASGAFNTQAVTLTITDVAPTITSATTVSVAEGTSTSTVVYTAAASDPAGGTVTYSLGGADAGAFTIDGSTGAVTFNAPPDFETKSSYAFTVQASDASGAVSTQAVALSVTDVAPTITSATTVSVAEGTSAATVVYTASATDPAGGAVTYSLTGADAGAFTIDSSTGAVRFNAPPDFETKSSYSFNVKASDASGAFNTQAVSLSVTDVAPTITSATTVSVAEGTATSTVVYTASAADPAGGAVTYSLTGADAGAFTIDSSTGAVTFNAVPDFETKSSYSFNVQASDASGAFNTQAVTLSVTDVAPTITSATSVTVPEGTSAATVIYTASAADPAGGSVTYSLTGADAAAFTIDATTGAVTFNAVPDFETKNAYSFNVQASDASGAFNTQAVTVAVSDVAPAITSSTTASVAEGTATTTVVYTAAATDPAGGAVSFSLSGADAGAFTIDNSTGAVTFNAVPDFETKSTYSFTVVASDASAAASTQAVTLTVTDLAPTITSASTVSVAEGTSTSTVVYTASATDPAGGAVTYSLTGADAGAFTIDSSTGAVTFKAVPDFETKSSYSFNVQATDASGAFNTQAVSLSVTDVAPTITSATTVSVAEGTATSTVVYTASATDPAGGAVTYSLTGADAGAFSIDASTGAVTFNAVPDFETKSSYSFDVRASDASGAFNTQAVTVTVTDVAPTISSATSVSVAEGTPTSTIVYVAAATDPAGGAVTYSLSGADAAAFSIDPSTGAVRFNAVPDFETKNSYSVTVCATDASGAFNTQAVSLSVTDVAPSITSATTVSVAEGTPASTVVYTAAANDPAGGAVTYSLAGADAAAFTIDSTTGAVTFNAAPDFETKSAYSFVVKASDASGAFSTQAVSLSVTDVAPTITSATAVSVAEGTSTSTVVYTASATDPAGGAVSYALSGADAGAFSIDSSTGAVTFNAVPDFETKSSYTFNVEASDASGASNTQAVTVTVTDVAPAITSATTVSVAEGTSTSTVVYTASAADPAGGAVTYSLTGADAAAFTIDGATGAVTFNAVPDFETKSSYAFAVQASDASGAVSTQAVALSITNVAPSVTSSTTVDAAEGTSTSTVVYTATAADPAGGAVTYSLTGADAGAFTIDPATGAVTFKAVPDYETKSSYSFSVRVADSSGAFSDQAVTLNVTDRPSVISSGSGAITETNAAQSVTGALTASDGAGNTAFVPQAATAGAYGTFAIDASGAWTYTMDAAHDELAAGQVVSETFTVSTVDGVTLAGAVTVTLTGTNDAAVITGSASGSVTEAGTSGPGTATATGTLSVTDVDSAATFTPVAAGSASDGGYGTYSLTAGGAWAYSLDNANATVQALASGQTLVDTFTAHTADGTTRVVTITINGADDATVITGLASGSVVEAGASGAGTPTASGTLSASGSGGALTFDAVTSPAATSAGYGTYTIASNGDWTYSLDNANAAVDALAPGQTLTDSFTVSAADGTTQIVTVVINGADDATVIGGVASSTITETNAVLSTGGQLTASDPDSSAAFNVQNNVAGTYGSFTIDATGAWTYTTSGALDNLAAGQTVTDSFTVTTADGTSQVVTVTINGTDDRTVIGGVATATLTETNAVLSTGGQLTAIDPDSSAAFNVQSNVAGTYGSFSIDATGAWTYTTSSALDNLAAGQTVTDSFTVTTADGTSQVVTVTINGTDDQTVIGGVATATVTETNAVLSTGGQLTATDPDSSAAFNVQSNVAGTYGSFSIDATGAWSYTTSGALDNLAAGQTATDSFTASTADGTSQVVTVTINGTDDQTVIGGVATATLTETNAVLSTGGQLTATDPDSSAAFNVQSNVAGTYGSFTIDAAGAWTYTTSSALDNLSAGQTVTDSFTVTTADGTSQVVAITINGTDDQTVISGVATATLTETNAVLSTGGQLTATDPDSSSAFNAQNNVAGTYGSFSIDATGAWRYTTSSALDNLAAGQSVTDSFTVTTADGTSQVVTVTINGTDDQTVIGGVATATLTETNAVLSTSGQLTSSDPDSSAAFNVQSNVAGSYGSFSIDATGAWTYTTNGALDNLAAGQTVTDSFTVTTADGTSQLVTVTINGTDDQTVIGGVATATLTETNAVLSTGGQLTSTDPDSSAAFNVQNNVAGTYGSFSIDATGAWSYTTSGALDNLAAGQTVTDSFTVTTADGTSQVVAITINGTDDQTVIGGVATATLTETNAVLSTGGQLTATDPDSSAAFNAQNNVAGAYGAFSIDAAGAWAYTTSSALDNLAAGQTVTDSFTVTTADGTSQVVTVTINGTDDQTVIGGVATATLTETNAVLTTGGQLTSSDPDSSAAFNVQNNVAGTYGSFSIDAAGAWTYTTSSALDFLAAGQTVTDSFTVTTADGTSQLVTVTINGTAETTVIGGVATATLTETNAILSTAGQLVASDPNGAVAFNPQANVAGAYGVFDMDATGAWTYTTNGALDGLAAGQTVTDSFTATTVDGTSQVVTVTINGTDDQTVIGGVATATLNETNAALSTGGQLTSSDPDSSAAFNVQNNVAGAYGGFSIDATGAWTYTTNGALDNLAAGQTVTDSFTVTTADGTSQLVTVTINGTDDQTVIGGVATATITETNVVLSTGGQLTGTDPDSSAAFNVQNNVAGTYGSFSIDATGAWTYTTSSALDNLAAGQTVTDSFTVSTADGTSQVVTITINGTDDQTVIAGVATATLTETNAVLSTGGQLTASDPDSSAAFNVQSNVAGTYGSFSIDAAGAWTYSTSSALDSLAAGQTVTDSFTVTTADGTSQLVTVTINGTDDQTVIGGVATATITETNVVLSTGGQLTAADPDSSAAFNVQSNVAGSNGYGVFSIDATGAWTYTTNDALDSLAAGQTVTDSFTVTTADGTSQVVTVTINGTDDRTVIGGVATATITETNVVLSTGGQLTSADPDSSAAFNVQNNVAGTYGSFSVDATGAWTYTTSTALDGLAAGQTVTDSFTVTTADGTSQLVTVTINGTDDQTVIGGVATATLTETNAVLTSSGQLTATDPDSPAAFNVQTNVAGTYGSFSIDATGAWTYTTNSALDALAAGQSVTDTFTVTTVDGTSRGVTVTIDGTNDAPVVTADVVSALQNVPLVISAPALLGNDSDVDGGSLSISAFTQPANGTLVDNGDGTFSYTPATNFFGTDSFTYTASDGNGGSATTTVTIDVAERNLAPVLTAVTRVTTFTEDGAAVPLFAGSSASAVEAGQTITRLDVVVSNVSDGAAERLLVDGSSIALVDGTSGTTAGAGLSYTVSVSGGNATLTLGSAAGVSAATIQSLIDALAYQDASQDPTPGDRVVTLARIDDSGSSSGLSRNSTTLNIASTVTVVAVNDAPTLALSGLDPVFIEGPGSTQGTPVTVFSGAAIANAESAQGILGFTFTVSGLVDGANEVVVVDGTSIALGANNAGTTAGGIGYSVTVVGATATVSLSAPAAMSAAAAESVIDAIAYSNTNVDNPTPGNRVFTMTALRDSGGTANFGSDTRALAIASTVGVVASDDAPTVAAPLPAGLATSGVPFTYSVPAGTFADADSATLVLSATQADGSPLPAWLAFDPLTGMLSGTPPAGFSSLALQVTASDGSRSVSTGLVVSASVARTAPQIAPTAAPVTADVPPTGTTAPAEVVVLAATSAPTVAPVALALPVDASVPAAHFADAVGATPPASAAPPRDLAPLDLNALPPTGAGPTAGLGFPLAQVSFADASMLGATTLQLASDSHRLIVFQGIPNFQIGPRSGDIEVPRDAFAHTDPAAVVRLEARLADGRPLPEWLHFDGVRGTFSGTPPDGLVGLFEIEVVARDTAGREARTRFALLVEDLRAGRVRDMSSADPALGLDVDKKESEKARLEAKQAGKAAPIPAQAKPQPRDAAASFSEQLRAARASRDPLLDRIAKPEGGKPTPRR